MTRSRWRGSWHPRHKILPSSFAELCIHAVSEDVAAPCHVEKLAIGVIARWRGALYLSCKNLLPHLPDWHARVRRATRRWRRWAARRAAGASAAWSWTTARPRPRSSRRSNACAARPVRLNLCIGLGSRGYALAPGLIAVAAAAHALHACCARDANARFSQTLILSLAVKLKGHLHAVHFDSSFLWSEVLRAGEHAQPHCIASSVHGASCGYTPFVPCASVS